MRSARRWWLACLLCIGGGVAHAQDIAIVGARVVPSPEAEVIASGTVVVRDGRVVAVGPSDGIDVPDGITTIDGRGTTLLAGFWNSHVHFLAPETRAPASVPADALESALASMLTRWGFTTVFDISSIGGAAAAMRARIEAGEVRGPDILYVDTPFFPEGGTPSYVRDLFDEMQAPSAEVATADEARTRADAQLAAGADGVKLFAGAILGGALDVLPMDVDVARAIVEAAHRAGKPAFAHPTNVAGLEVSLAAGVDILAHTTPVSGPWDEAMVQRLRAANMALTPTLTLFDHELRREGAPQEVIDRFLEAATQQVRAYHAAGGDILFGTDVDFIQQYDTRLEFELLRASGLDWRAILATLTTTPARRFGQDDRKGRIAEGLQADLVLLEGDPADDVAAFARVRQVLRAGRMLYRARDEGR
ncbi:amidohydrolase [Luteimonas aestuarii]|uniref:Amidohydrolase n=2 Tax=Luteimonas aestuarii TaxID=453837 RepID=A0A4R5U4S9_9GAMM|nr:amidohydrolase [Luteimonas aestuarii]